MYANENNSRQRKQSRRRAYNKDHPKEFHLEKRRIWFKMTKKTSTTWTMMMMISCEIILIMDKKSKIKSVIKFDDDVRPVVEKPIPEPIPKKKKKEIKKQKLRHITLAIPDSIVANAQSSELRSYFMS